MGGAATIRPALPRPNPFFTATASLYSQPILPTTVCPVAVLRQLPEWSGPDDKFLPTPSTSMSVTTTCPHQSCYQTPLASWTPGAKNHVSASDEFEDIGQLPAWPWSPAVLALKQNTF